MSLNKKYKIASEFEGLFEFESPQEEFEHEKTLLSLKFLSEVQTILESESLTKKELAQMLETSASYITQLYKGDRLVNMAILAKIQEKLDIVFEIKAIPNKMDYASVGRDYPFIYTAIIVKKSNKFRQLNRPSYDFLAKKPLTDINLETA